LHRGPILMPPTTFCQDSDRMARCALEGSNTILKVIIILLLCQCIVVMYFLRNQLLFYDTWYCIYASISSSHNILWRREKSFELAIPACDFMHHSPSFGILCCNLFCINVRCTTCKTPNTNQ
jgi:hypothetical protein